MGSWTRLADVSECLAGQAIERVVSGQVVALFNVEGRYFALDGICPHQGGPLGKGQLHGCIVTCPWHGWQFDVKSGQSQLAASVVQPRLEVKIEGDTVWVWIESRNEESRAPVDE